jgi:hypothetical protein
LRKKIVKGCLKRLLRKANREQGQFAIGNAKTLSETADRVFMLLLLDFGVIQLTRRSALA